MGLGFGANVATRQRYATIIENMVDQGLIDTPAYSLYLVRPLNSNWLLFANPSR